MNIFLNIIEAIRAIRANFLRTVITVLIIAFGLTALIGVLTAIDGIKFWFSDSFIRIGANTFRIENYDTQLRSNGGPRRSSVHEVISYDEAFEFKENFKSMAPVSVVETGSVTASASYKGKRTQNNLRLIGSDPQFVLTDKMDIAEGRNISQADIDNYSRVILIGHEVVEVLFEQASPIGKRILMNGKSYLIIGVFEEVGSQGVTGGDKICVIPASTLAQNYPQANRSYSLHVLADRVEDIDYLTFEAMGDFRRVRGLKPTEENNFGIIKTEAMIANIMENIRFLTWSATFIAIITLVSASIGLMNIMLVSVTERTREIGVRKALGARRSTILFQFLTEAVVITQLGGLLGIFMGVSVGNLVGYFLGSGFLIPWNWVLGGVLLCVFVGVIAGLYPARKAAALDPIESLRYE